MAQNKVPLANLGRSINLVLFEGLECIQVKKNVFQFFSHFYVFYRPDLK